MKRILITGKNSYIGTSFERYIQENYPKDFQIDTLDMLDKKWKEYDFSTYDTIFHVAGIAHQKETKQNEHLYYEINRDLAIKVANKAKEEGTAQFVLMSSMSVYGLIKGHITKTTLPKPQSAYGKSKLAADNYISRLSNSQFKVVILRPPMVYGYNCKGNYQLLRQFVLKFKVFPDIVNKRSMVYIDNLSEFIAQIIKLEKSGLFFPQNEEYVSTLDMAKNIAEANKFDLKIVSIFNPIIRNIKSILIDKVFGDLTYEQVDTISSISFHDSIYMTERINYGYTKKRGKL